MLTTLNSWLLCPSPPYSIVVFVTSSSTVHTGENPLSPTSAAKEKEKKLFEEYKVIFCSVTCLYFYVSACGLFVCMICDMYKHKQCACVHVSANKNIQVNNTHTRTRTHTRTHTHRNRSTYVGTQAVLTLLCRH